MFRVELGRVQQSSDRRPLFGCLCYQKDTIGKGALRLQAPNDMAVRNDTFNTHKISSEYLFLFASSLGNDS